MNHARSSPLITFVGWINISIGLVFVAFGVYVLLAGTEAVASLFQLKSEVENAAGQIPGMQGAAAKKADDIGDALAKGLSGIILAMVGVVAGCAIVQGLPIVLVGVGVLVRSNIARIFAILFAILAMIEAIACLGSIGQSNRFLFVGIALASYFLVTMIALIGKRATFEFSGGLRQAAESTPTEATPEADMNTSSNSFAVVTLSVLLMVASATAAVFATLYYTAKEPTFVQLPDGKNEAKPAPLVVSNALAKHKPRVAALHEAVLGGQIPRAVEMLKEVDLDEPDEQGRTALMKAAGAGNLRMTMFLLAMGAHVDQADRDGKTAVMHAVENNQSGILDVLNDESNAREQIAAFRAQYFDLAKAGLGGLKNLAPANFKAVQPNLQARDENGHSATMIAILKGYPELANKLSRPGWGGRAENITDAKGNTLLHLLAADGNIRMLRHFRILTVNKMPFWAYTYEPNGPTYSWQCCPLNPVNNAGHEPWMIAAEKGNLDIVKHLLVQPTLEELQRKDNAGKTGLDLAAANNHKEVVAYLTKVQEDLTAKLKKSD